MSVMMPLREMNTSEVAYEGTAKGKTAVWAYRFSRFELEEDPALAHAVLLELDVLDRVVHELQVLRNQKGVRGQHH